LATAMEVLEVTNAKANMLRVIDLMTPSVINLIQRQHPNLDSKVLEEFQTAFRGEMSADSDTLIKSMAQIYIKHFSDSDLQGILQFYRTPTGKKLITEMPVVIKESTELGMAWGQVAGQRAAERAVARLRKEGIKI